MRMRMRSFVFLLPFSDCSSIRLYLKSPNPLKMSFKLKLCSFVSVPSLFQKETNAFDSFGIEYLLLSVDVKYGNTIMIMAERNFVLVLWILEKVVFCLFFLTYCTTLVY